MDEERALPMRAPRRDQFQHTHDKTILANIALTNPGASSPELALIFEERTGRALQPRTIRDDLQAIRETWLEEMVGDYNQLKAIELARLRVLEQEAWNAWRQSQDDFIKQVVERAGRPPASSPPAGTLTAQIVERLAEKNAYLSEEVVETIVHDAIREAAEEGIDAGEDDEMFVARIIDTTEGRVGDVTFLREIFKVQAERRKVLGVYAPERHQIDIRKAEVKVYKGWSPAAWEKDEIKDPDAEPVEGFFEEVSEE